MIPVHTLYALILLQYAVFCMGVHESFNFILGPGKVECFYEDLIDPSLTRVVEVFMEAGGLVDIILTIHGPLTVDDVWREELGDAVVSKLIDIEDEEATETLAHSETFTASVEGTYALCLDNSKARFIPKAVQLDVHLPPRLDPSVVKSAEHNKKQGSTKDATTGDKASSEDQEDLEAEERLKETLTRIQRGLTKIQMQQQRDRRRLSFQDKMNTDNNNDIIMSSIVETAFFIGAALFQIFFVRRWFASRTAADGKAKMAV